MNKKKYKGMKVSEDVYNKLNELRVRIIQKGIKNLPFDTSDIKNMNYGTIINLCIKAIEYLFRHEG